MMKPEKMDLDLVITGKDEAMYKETLNKNGIKVDVKVFLFRESLVAKTPIKKKLIEQSTTRVNIDVHVTEGITKVITNAGAFAVNLFGYEDPYRGLRVTAAPLGSVYDVTINARAFAMKIAKNVMEAAIREQSHVGPTKLAKTLDLLGNVVKNFAIEMNVMKMNVNGLTPFTTAKQSKSYCETVLWVIDSSPNAAPGCASRCDDVAESE